jgi:hypothetical protein
MWNMHVIICDCEDSCADAGGCLTSTDMFFENLCYREKYAMRASNNRHQKIAQQEQALILANKYIDASLREAAAAV